MDSEPFPSQDLPSGSSVPTPEATSAAGAGAGYPDYRASGAMLAPHSQPTYPDYGPPPAEARPRVDGFAITALITGILGGVLLSIGFGIAALLRINRGRRRGRGLAIAGLALSGVWILALVAIFAYQRGRQPDRSASGAITRQGQIAPGDLRIGDCLLVPRVLTGTYTELTVTPCGQAHNGQVFDVVQATDATYPGEATLRAEALEVCRAAVPAFLGTGETPLHIVAFFPPENSWKLGGRAEHCLLIDRAKSITGDIRSDR